MEKPEAKTAKKKTAPKAPKATTRKRTTRKKAEKPVEAVVETKVEETKVEETPVEVKVEKVIHLLKEYLLYIPLYFLAFHNPYSYSLLHVKNKELLYHETTQKLFVFYHG